MKRIISVDSPDKFFYKCSFFYKAMQNQTWFVRKDLKTFQT